jgi:peptide chain release factor 2
LAELEVALAHPDLWKDPDKAQVLLKERSELGESFFALDSLTRKVEDQGLLLRLAAEEEDPTILPEVAEAVAGLEQEISSWELQLLLGGEHDQGNAILSINAGAGGTESQDWAQMLLRMYLRWAEDRKYKAQIIDIQPGEEAGIKSAAVTMSGLHAYGYLKSESGVHRLVRISPFDFNKRRHTSFASVFVFPEIDDHIEVEINESDLRIDTFRSSSAGGQHVNVTDSAVRITHIPTGIVVSCQNERSQHKNKAMAMKVLRARLYERYQREQQEKMAEMEAEKKEIGWGSQIRSYVLAPYQLVKDHRTGYETSNVDAVLDGALDPFIEAFLRQSRNLAD